MILAADQLVLKPCCPLDPPREPSYLPFLLEFLGIEIGRCICVFILIYCTCETPVQPNLRSSGLEHFILDYIVHKYCVLVFWRVILVRCFWIKGGILIYFRFCLCIKLYSFCFLQKCESWDWISKGPVQRNRCWWKHLVSFIQFTCLICLLILNMTGNFE